MRSSWSTRKVKELCTLIVDCVNKTAPKEDGPTPFKMIRTTNIKGGRLDTDNCNFVSEETFIKWTRRAKLEPKDILLTREAPIGEAAQVKCGTGLFLGQRIMQYRPDPIEVDPDYLFFSFLSPTLKEQFGMHEGSGSTVSHIRVGDCSEFDIPCPSIEEQRRVSAVLRALFDYEEVLSEQNTTLEALAQTLFRSWFVNFDPVHAKAAGQTPEGMSPELAALFPSKFIESELGMIPKGWAAVKVEDVCDFIKGRSYKSVELAESTTALVTLKSFQRGGGFRRDGFKPYIGTYKPEQIVKVGECIVALTDVTQNADVIGRPAKVLPSSYQTMVASLDVGILRPIKSSLHVDFLSCLLKEPSYVSHVLQFTSGTTVLHLAKEGVPSYKFAISDEPILRTFADLVSPIFSSIELNHQKSDVLESLRDELLPRLISGKLRIEEAEEAVSEVLGSTTEEEKAA